MVLPAISLNGVPCPVKRDSMRVTEEDYGDLSARAVGGHLLETTSGKKRTWRFSTPPLRLYEEAWPLAKMINGLGQGWTFDDVTYWRYSFAGIRDTNATATVSRGTSAPTPHLGTGRLQVNASQFFTFPPRHRCGIHRKGATPDVGGWTVYDGFTLHFARYNGATWDYYSVTGPHSGANFARASSANPAGWTQYKNGVAGSYAVGYAINMEDAGNGVGLCGWDLTNAASTQYYDHVVFWPFEMPTATWRWPSTPALPWAGSIQAEVLGLPPYLKLGGWDVPDWGETSLYIDVRGSVAGWRQMSGKLPGASAFESYVYELDIELREV